MRFKPWLGERSSSTPVRRSLSCSSLKLVFSCRVANHAGGRRSCGAVSYARRLGGSLALPNALRGNKSPADNGSLKLAFSHRAVNQREGGAPAEPFFMLAGSAGASPSRTSCATEKYLRNPSGPSARRLLTVTTCLYLLLSMAGNQLSQASQPAEPSGGQTQSRPLRHAVFFKFKDSSSKDDVQQVVDAFRALPAKIPAITGFQWGVNNSGEGFDDGLTHCFLLTFADEAGRAAYLPHRDHKAFGNVLRPHLDKVFVVDYWGSSSSAQLKKELKHAVFFKFKDDASDAAVKAIEEQFAALPEKIKTIKGFEWGKNNSPEKHDAGFTHCFMVTFDSESGRDTYLPHPAHKQFVAELLQVLDKVRVLDFWAQP